MSSKKSCIPGVTHHLSNFFWIDIVKAELVIFFLSVLVDVSSRLVPSVMISLAVVIIKFFLLFVIIVYQNIPVADASSINLLSTDHSGCAVSVDVPLAVPAILLHQGSLSVNSSVLLLLHLIDNLLLLLTQICVVSCHYIKL